MIERKSALELPAWRAMPPSLKQHALASEAVLRALARRFSEDEEVWGLTGLLHDLDYPSTSQTPERHGLETADTLSGLLPEESLTAIRAHSKYPPAKPGALPMNRSKRS